MTRAVERARDAFDRQAWTEACAAFTEAAGDPAVGDGPLMLGSRA